MIAESDNTATDLLIDLLGRDRIVARLGLATQDLLTTREFFALKADPAAVSDWLAATGERPAIAVQAALSLPDSIRASGPQVLGLGWYLPLTRLCALMGAVGDLPLMAVNPGPVATGPWTVAFKGGSEAGVLNMTVQLRDAAGHRTCVAVNWNSDSAPDTAQATAALRTVIHHLVPQ